jgi:proton-translocating NADH-quinone oxidoreductase chain L
MLEFHPETDFKLLLAVPLIPLVGYTLQIFLRRRLPYGDKLLTLGMFAVLCITVLEAAKAIAAAHHGQAFFHQSAEHGWVFKWLSADKAAGDPGNLAVGILYDPLGAVMLAVVGVVSFCVHLFSIGYMHGDRRYPIFFANISLFTFAMLGLVLADNILFLFVFWELMGLMSYLLIGHFAHDPSNPFFHRWATWASKKAFLTTRVGDVCLFAGMMMFYSHFHTLRFTELWAAARDTWEANGDQFPTWMTWAGLLCFGGTMGKSAQFPLHIWLPDAMAGPTPVSAMIHAATMVAAGIFLLGRLYPLMTPEVLTVVTVVGASTALFAATIGTTVHDLKAVLAYSTISQLGFMAAAVGLGGVVAGMFHMVTHAFFKACLFLSAGSVIHGCHHEQDMRRMGGLRRLMPATYWCMLLCTLAIAGVPFFSGFYSKDMILAAGFEGVLGAEFEGWKLYALIALAAAATLTAFYMFRLIFVTFFGEYRGEVHAGHAPGHGEHGHAEHGHGGAGHGGHAQHDHGEDDDIAHGHGGPRPHESPLPIVAALVVLAFLGVLGGHFWLADGHFWKFWHAETWFQELARLDRLYPNVAEWLHARFPHDERVAHLAHSRAVTTSLVIGPLGIALAWFLYVKRRDLPAKICALLGPLYQLVARKYYVDEIVDATLVRGTRSLASICKLVDEHVVDALVLLVGRIHRVLGSFWAWFDQVFVDGAVNGVGLVSQSFGALARLVQTGRVQQYAAFAMAGGLLAAAWLILS